MSIYKQIINMQNDLDVIDERKEELEMITSVLVIALRSQPCRCQMRGGAMWHLRASMEVSRQCSRCMALEMYSHFVERG